MTKYRSTCDTCGSQLSQLALSSGICTPCWWKTEGWLRKGKKSIILGTRRQIPAL